MIEVLIIIEGQSTLLGVAGVEKLLVLFRSEKAVKRKQARITTRGSAREEVFCDFVKKILKNSEWEKQYLHLRKLWEKRVSEEMDWACCLPNLEFVLAKKGVAFLFDVRL